MTGVACGLVFQLPLFMGFLTWVGVLTPRILGKYWRHSIVVIFILAAVLTPADPVSQLVLAVPLLVLYGLGFLVAVVLHRGRRRRQAGPGEAGTEAETGPGQGP
jgi:sec-independent protein translocase protein TatC